MRDEDEQADKSSTGEQPWMRYAGMVESGDRDSSLKIDEVVYAAVD